jgi:hypothetical protein
MTGAEHALKGKAFVDQWLRFAEFSSDQYAMVAIQPLIVLANYAPGNYIP